MRRLTDGWASRSTGDGAAPPGYRQAIRLSLDGSWSSLARLRRMGCDRVTLRGRHRRRGASSRDAGDKLPASGRPLAGRELVAAGQATDGRPPVRSTISLAHAAELIKAANELAALHGRRHNLSRQSTTLTDKLRRSANSTSPVVSCDN